jgi:FtsP/CotA-like multicopper oxidase with cupredoxin domain
VTYPYYLINGRINTAPQVKEYRAGQRIRLRIINAGADTAFRVGVPGTGLTVTHTDGYPVVPHHAESVILGMGERVDATITVSSSVPVIAAAEGKDGYARLDLRVGPRVSEAPVAEFIDTMRRAQVLNTATLVSPAAYALAQRDSRQTLDLRLAGPGPGYTWPINGRLYDPPDNGLNLTFGERVRMRFINESMMFHPMHLHGHTFQVVRAGGSGPRKDTVLVPPKQTVEVDFDTDNPGRWIVHCHNDYHLAGGMATFVSYTV